VAGRVVARSGLVSLKVLRLQHDEVLVKRLEGGVGKARGAVEYSSANEHHIEEFYERAAGEAVEEGFLVEAALVEVSGGEGCCEGGILQALVVVDELGFHGGVLVVLGYPVGDALGEGVVIEGMSEVGDGTLDLDDFVDGAGISSALGADETDVEGGYLGVFEPGAEEEVAAAQAESADFSGCGEGELLHLR